MNRSSVRANGGFALALVILGVLGGVSIQSAREVSRAEENRRLNRQRVTAIDSLLSKVKDAETGQRGFLLTGKDSYLVPYLDARNEYEADLVKLRNLNLGDPAQLSRIARVETLADEKLEELGETIELRKSEGYTKALAVVQSDRGFLLMRELRELLGQMRKSQELALAEDTRKVSESLQRTRVIIPIGSTLGIALVILAAFIAARDGKRRREAEAVAQAFTERLEKRVGEATHELRKALVELESKSNLLETILEQMPMAVIVGEAPTGRLILANPQVKTVWRHPLIETKDLAGYSAWQGFHSDGRPYAATDWPLARALLHGHIIRNEDTDVLRGDGTRGILRLSAAPIRRDGAIVAGVVICEDVTERKSVEEIEKRERAAIEASHVKSQFLANMSHEIRTPMNAIIGMAELLADTSLDEDQKRYVESFRKAGDNLLSLLNDILDISKIEAGDLAIDQLDFDLTEVVESATELMAPRAHLKGLELAVRIKPDVPTLLRGDPNRVRQVLGNLMGNAIKFTAKGEVLVLVERDPAASSPTALRFTVSDTGIGIPQDKIGGLFERFAQVDTSITRRYGGTGLGLNISKQLVGMMGGKIGVESEAGVGTRFHFTLKFESQVGVPQVRKPEEMSLKGLRALIVDDNATNRLILGETLRSWGAQAVEMEDGALAVQEMKRAHEAGTPYELLLLDFRMPGLDGFEVAEAVRLCTPTAGLLMMMLTSDNRIGALSRCQELGIGSLLVKPLKKLELWNALSAAKGYSATKPSVAVAAKAVAPHSSDRSLRVLLVDDSEDNRFLIQAHLKRTPHVVTTAENGRLAYDQFTAGEFDVILMDMQMPVMDGYTATKLIRQWESDHGRPRTYIVALTAYALKTEADRSYSAGCDLHLTKPVKKEVLMRTLQELASARKEAA